MGGPTASDQTETTLEMTQSSGQSEIKASAIVGWYDTNAARLAPTYNSVPPLIERAWLTPLLPKPPAVVVDIGAGTGRDAAAFATAGYDVIAVEPSPGMRTEASKVAASSRIQWITDSLPALASTTRAGIAADVVCLSAVWQHIPPVDRPRAFRKLVGLLRSGGLLVITLRHGPDDGRGSFPVDTAEVEALARGHGMQIVVAEPSRDFQGRPEISWTNLVLRLPDDGTGALPLLRHIILNDAKSATYKLGLLRALCRAADSAGGTAVEDGDEFVQVPLGLVALNWLRLYLPLVKAELPQTPGNHRASEGLGFAGSGWNALVDGGVSPIDLRIGAALGPEGARVLHSALREAVGHICRMPATYLTFPGGEPILVPARLSARKPSAGMILDRDTLSAFGSFRVPMHLWTAMRRYSVWIEPALVAEWQRLMDGYASKQGRQLDPSILAAAMTWSDPSRDVAIARDRALALLRKDQLHCVWSGKRLTTSSLDIDHCFPWSAWPCADLWNLLPADRRLNQHHKRERLPSAGALNHARDAISSWWLSAYQNNASASVQSRFIVEARASLPGLVSAPATPSIDDLFDAAALQRLRLRQDQGVPEWEPSPIVGATPSSTRSTA